MPELVVPPVMGDVGAADRLLQGLGCARCRVASLGLAGRKYAPCHPCQRMAATSPSTRADVQGRHLNGLMQPGSMIADLLKRAGWVFISQSIAGYVARTTRAPWLRVEWSMEGPPEVIGVLSRKTETIAQAWSSWGSKNAVDTTATFHAPVWLSQLLNAGTVLRKAKLNGGANGLDWPRVLTYFAEHPAERAAVSTVVITATSAPEAATDAERLLGVEPKATIDPVPIASFIRDGWPHLIGAQR